MQEVVGRLGDLVVKELKDDPAGWAGVDGDVEKGSRVGFRHVTSSRVLYVRFDSVGNEVDRVIVIDVMVYVMMGVGLVKSK